MSQIVKEFCNNNFGFDEEQWNQYYRENPEQTLQRMKEINSRRIPCVNNFLWVLTYIIVMFWVGAIIYYIAIGKYIISAILILIYVLLRYDVREKMRDLKNRLILFLFNFVGM